MGNLKVTIKLIIAMLIASATGYGVFSTLDSGSCGSMDVYDKFVVIHTSCKFKVSHGDIPSVRTEKGILYIQLPEGWKWRVVPE